MFENMVEEDQVKTFIKFYLFKSPLNRLQSGQLTKDNVFLAAGINSGDRKAGFECFFREKPISRPNIQGFP